MKKPLRDAIEAKSRKPLRDFIEAKSRNSADYAIAHALIVQADALAQVHISLESVAESIDKIGAAVEKLGYVASAIVQLGDAIRRVEKVQESHAQ
jgi:hypothetical protein